LLPVDVGAASHGKLEGHAWVFGARVFEQYIVELLVVRESRAWEVQSVADPPHCRASRLVQRKAGLATETALV
jgi:hypothetical protein